MENHSSMTGWQKGFLVIFNGHYNHYFWDIWLKIYSLPNFNMLFQLVLISCFKNELLFTKSWSLDQLMYKRPTASAHLDDGFPHCPICAYVCTFENLLDWDWHFRYFKDTCINISKVAQRTSRQHKDIVNLPLHKCCCCCWCYPFIFII